MCAFIKAFIFSLTILIAVSGAVATSHDSLDVRASISSDENELKAKKLELFEGVSLKFPDTGGNSTDKLFSIEVDVNKDTVEGRGKQKKLMQRILPLFIMPFVLQSAIVPLFLSMLKFMLMKSLMVGKLALFLILINAFKNHNSFKGRQEAEMANIHYGYHGNGMEEYGAYIN